jgi:hypothetical protein
VAGGDAIQLGDRPCFAERPGRSGEPNAREVKEIAEHYEAVTPPIDLGAIAQRIEEAGERPVVTKHLERIGSVAGGITSRRKVEVAHYDDDVIDSRIGVADLTISWQHDLAHSSVCKRRCSVSAATYARLPWCLAPQGMGRTHKD